jgi:hypothetical protein
MAFAKTHKDPQRPPKTPHPNPLPGGEGKEDVVLCFAFNID